MLNGADLYNALSGNDIVTLPNAAHYQLTNPPTDPIVTWDPANTFNAGPDNDMVSVPTGQSSEIIDGDAGSDTVRYTGGTFSIGNLFSYNAATRTATYGDYSITNNGNTVNSTGKAGVQVTVADAKANISDVLKNVEYASIGGTKLPLEAIDVSVNINRLGGGNLSWILNGQPMGSENIYYDPTLPFADG